MSRPSTRPSPRIQPTRRPSLSLPLSVPQRSGSTSGPSRPKTKASTRTSKATQKLVELPSDPQTKPLLSEEEDVLGYATDAGVRVRERKSRAERMSKAERRKEGFRRITAYGVAEGVRIKVLSSFLKREHNVHPRVYDNALYAMYNLPLLPGYGPASNIRSSTHATEAEHTAAQANMSEAEESGYQGTYFAREDLAEQGAFNVEDGYIAAGSPEDLRNKARERERDERAGGEPASVDDVPSLTEGDVGTVVEVIPPAMETALLAAAEQAHGSPEISSTTLQDTESTAEVVFFDYGVIVFFGLQEEEERSILDDIANAGALRSTRDEDKWEVEELHYTYDRTVPSPRIYNDFFTFKNPSHLLTLSIAHALAQSTLLAYYESLTTSILSDPTTTSIPRTLALEGKLSISRTNAMRLTGKLFRLRRDVVLIGHILDVPDMFWEEASLRGLYDAVREYFELAERVKGVEERVAGARDLLDAIHEHLNGSAMERITIIIIWLIVAACLVEVGEVVARLIVHATTANSPIPSSTFVRGPLALMRTAASSSLVRNAASSALVRNPVSSAAASSVSTVANATGVVVQHANAFLDLSGMSREEVLNAVEIMMRAAGK